MKHPRCSGLHGGNPALPSFPTVLLDDPSSWRCRILEQICVADLQPAQLEALQPPVTALVTLVLAFGSLVQPVAFQALTSPMIRQH